MMQESRKTVERDELRSQPLKLGLPELQFFGTYHPDGRITFASRPKREWEFMATGTGVTGLTVSFPDEMVVQVNHSAAIDECGKLRALARLHLDLDGAPFVQATTFRMEHDLRRSVIAVVAQTADGIVRVEIRAHVPEDVIRIDIDDQRKSPGRLTVRLEEDAQSDAAFSQDTGLCMWHENDGTKVTDPRLQTPYPGIIDSRVEADYHSWLAGRTFGMSLWHEHGGGSTSERTLQVPPAAHHALYIVGLSTLGGHESFVNSVAERLTKVCGMNRDAFVTGHEAWWRDFWQRSHCTIHDPSGRMLKHQAAFDIYRYYLSCCSSDRRETPVRFLIDLFRYHTRNSTWMTMKFCIVEQYQSFYGALRTGDWESLRNVASFYLRKLPYYRHFCRRVYGHAGARIPYVQIPVVLRPPTGTLPEGPPLGVEKRMYNGESPAGALFALALFCDYVAVSGDTDFADDTLRPLAADLVEFYRLQYPERDQGQMVISPSNAGETFQTVRNPAETISALRMCLPRLIAQAKARKWSDQLIASWEELLAVTPDLPRGRLECDPERLDLKPVILPGDQLVPAADMSGCETYVLPWSNGESWYLLNRQNTELFAVWPGKLVLRDPALRECAVQSYRDRKWRHQYRDGWQLDLAFAACLGLHDEVAQYYDQQFEQTFVLPCGLAREGSPVNPGAIVDPTVQGIPEYPSMQGMGTGVVSVLEMLLQDYPDELIVLPCWPEDVPVDFALYSPFAGKVDVRYVPKTLLRVTTEREIRVRTGAACLPILEICTKISPIEEPVPSFLPPRRPCGTPPLPPC